MHKDTSIFSAFDNYSHRKPIFDFCLRDLHHYTRSKNEPPYKNLQRMLANPSQKSAIKSVSVCYTPHGLSLKEGNRVVPKHNGLIQIDIDAKDNPQIADWDMVRDWLFEWQHTAFAAISISGSGCYALVRVATSDLPAHFRAVAGVLAGEGLRVDKSKGQNLNELRFFSHDPGARVRFDARPYEGTFRPLPPAVVLPTTQGVKVPVNGSNSLIGQFNDKADIPKMLEAAGWRLNHVKGTHHRFTRPGKNHGTSADFDASTGRVYVFTSSTTFESGLVTHKAMDAFDLYMKLNNLSFHDAIKSIKD